MVLTSVGLEHSSDWPKRKQGKQTCIAAQGHFLSLQLCVRFRMSPAVTVQRVMLTLQFRYVVGSSMPGADGGAVERGGGAAEIELPLQGPALQETVDEASVKNVSGAGGVDGLDAEGSGVVEVLAIPSQYAFLAECCSGKTATKLFAEQGQGFFQIVFCREAFGNVPASDEEIDALQERFHTGIEFVQISNYGNAGGAGPARRCSCRSRIVSIDVKGARVNDPFLLEFFGTQGQAVVPFPKDSAFAGVVDQDEGLLAGTARSHEEMSFDAGSRKFRAVQFCGAVVANFADVTRAQSPLLASNHGGGDLAARQHLRRTKLDFGTARGIVVDGNECVGGVEANSDDVELR